MKLVSQDHVAIIKILITKKYIHEMYKKLHRYRNGLFWWKFNKKYLLIPYTLNFYPYFIRLERNIEW